MAAAWQTGYTKLIAGKGGYYMIRKQPYVVT